MSVNIAKNKDLNTSVNLTPEKLVPGPVGLTLKEEPVVKINGRKVGYLPYMDKKNVKKKMQE